MKDNLEKKLSEMKELIDEIDGHNYNYYTLDNPTISDREYDALFDRLRGLELETGRVLANSPTQRVGGDIVDRFERHVHLSKLLSLDKSQSYEELRNWDSRIRKRIDSHNLSSGGCVAYPDYVVEYKFDGLTVNLTYRDGELVQGATRGNGEVGESILAQIKTLRNIPYKIPYRGVIEVQGEGLMPFSAFEEYNKSAKEPLKNPRNGAAGALRNLDPKVTATRNLIAYCYNVNYIEDRSFKTQTEMFDFLKENKLPVNNYFKRLDSIDSVIEEIDRVEDEIKSLDVLTDGIVIKVDDIGTREILGFTDRFPRWAIAYKFESEEFTTRLLDVKWNVGRTGKVTPIAELEPVEINGVTVKRATLNNWDDIVRKGVKEGSTVWIRRSNDVIPEIMGTVDVEEDLREIEKPSHCPACGTELIHQGVHLFCENSLSCKPQLVSRLVHFASREAMDIEGLSEKTVEQLFEDLRLREIPDIYDLQYQQLIGLKRFGPKKAENLLKAIEESKSVKLSNFIYSLGIPNVGKKTSTELAKSFKRLDNLRQADLETLMEIDDIGHIVAGSIVDFFNKEEIQLSLERLIQKGIEIEFEEKGQAEDESSPYRDKKIVITGSIEGYSRVEIARYLEDRGAKVVGSVSKNTDLVIAGESAGSKYEKAKALGIEIVDGQSFKKTMVF